MTDSNLMSSLTEPASEILHPTDFSEQSEVALAHALRFALSNKSKLHLLHVANVKGKEDQEFPSVRKFLQRWGVLKQGASRSAVTDLGIGIVKVIDHSSDVPEAISQYCQIHPIDIIVLATAGRDGVASWLRHSKAEQIAERVSILEIPTLFVPSKTKGCVDVDSGIVTLNHVLVPVDHEPNPASAIEQGLRAISIFGGEQAKLTLLHIGSESHFPRVTIPDGMAPIERVVRKGSPVAEIVAAAIEQQSNLVIMVTSGSHGILDALRGTTTNQVMRQAPCPTLTIPTQW